MKAKFTIPGPPQGKGRPKFARRGNFVTTYTPEQTATYENLIKVEYERQCPNTRFEDGNAVWAYVLAFFPIPESASKKKKQQMLDGEIMPTKKPDADNILKIIFDSLNGVAYKDDTQITDVVFSKRYSNNPRVKVELYTKDELGKEI